MKLRVIKADDGFHYIQLWLETPYPYDIDRWVTIDRHWYESTAVDDMNKRLQREREYKKLFDSNNVIAEGEA